MRIPLQNKLIATEFNQDLAEIGYDIQGPTSSLYLNDDNASDGGEWQLAYMNSFGVTIAAGANEVQRNILGERVLGLAKSK
jgi:alkylation response protein AidB-like acyl-CoA dehydrogenase